MIRPSHALTTFTLALVACEPVPDAPAAACPAPRHGPTIHRSSIERDEVWRADEGPHIVAAQVRVRAGATLEIEPCAVVQLEADTGIDVAFPGTPTTGTLLALGTAERPIRFEGRAGAAWNHLRIDTGATARLAHVTLEGGGVQGATIVVSGDGTRPTHHNLFVDTVTVRGSRGVGIRLERDAGFIAGSQDLTVVDAESFPLVIDEHGIGSLPRGAYVGNGDDRIFIDPTGALTESATMKELGVPYLVGNFGADHLVVGGGFDTPLVTLTVEPGVRVEFFPGTALEVEHSTGDKAASGVLVAEGTAAAPIVFTSAQAVPARGDWRGIAFGGVPQAGNRIAHARIEYTGADCGCILSTCSAISEFEGAVIFSQQPPSAFISDTVIAHGKGHAVVLGYLGALVDFRDGIAVEDVAGCEQTRPAENVCPAPRPACM